MDFSTNHFSAAAAHDIIERLFRAPVERHVLDNGLTLVHRPDFSSEVVSVQVWVKTGSIHEDELIGSGLSHYLEHLLFKGTARRDGKSISREVHAMGGGINAYTTFDRTVYYIDAPSQAFSQIVDVLSDIVLHSTLPEQEVERERDVILREIDMGLDDPDRQLSQALFRTAFKCHPYREPVIGHRALYEQVTRDELYAYYKSRYVPNNIVVSIVGAVTPEDCLREVEATFGQAVRGRLARVTLIRRGWMHWHMLWVAAKVRCYGSVCVISRSSCIILIAVIGILVGAGFSGFHMCVTRSNRAMSRRRSML
jgi:zinc protease